MKNLFFLFVLCLLISCGKDEPESQMKSVYPQKYVLGDFEPGETQVFKVNGNEFEKLTGVPGSFAAAEMYHIEIMRDERDEFMYFKIIELLSEDSVKISVGDGSGFLEDETVAYILQDSKIQIYVDGQFIPFFEKDDANEVLRYCWQTNWAAFTNDAGNWERNAYNNVICNESSDEERLAEAFDRCARRSDAVSVDTIALHKSAYLFPLEQ